MKQTDTYPTNQTIAAKFLLLSKLMEIYGDNPFKIKSYAYAARIIDKYPVPLHTLSLQDLEAIQGIGSAIGQKITDLIQTGHFAVLDAYLHKTPAGILEMLQIKGLGPKKIAMLWHDLGIETIGELLYACEENRLMLYKGFGEKTQNNIQEAILFFQKSKGQFLYADIAPYATELCDTLKENFPENTFLPVGAIPEQQEIISEIAFVTDATDSALATWAAGWKINRQSTKLLELVTPENIKIIFNITSRAQLGSLQFALTGSADFHEAWGKIYNDNGKYADEKDIFAAHHLPYIAPYLRETADIIEKAQQNTLPQVIQTADIKGIIHCHSTWSDGSNTLEDMADAAKRQGYEYLIISDHSQSAFYAHGLKTEDILRQHEAIDQLNKKLYPFKIFKSIESDILNDGSLDYPDAVLQSFDLIIASIHSNLRMPEEKAMERLLNAIANPYTSILGHMTGRLLLSRAGYPVDTAAVIEACKEYNVVIELNANPRRLDIDWRYISQAVDKHVLLSIDPDAHKIESYDDNRYGVLVAQKAGLTAAQNLSSFSLAEMEKFIAHQHQKRK